MMPPQFAGLKVVVSPLLGPLPKIRLPDSFEWCTDAFRVKHNKWLLDRFGMAEDTALISDATGCVYISQNMARKLGIA